jgi:hypothetical protein
MTTFYAIEHFHGRTTCDSDGNHLGKLHAFETKAERDDWVAAPGRHERTPVRMADIRDRRLVRSCLRLDKEFGAGLYVWRHRQGEEEEDAWAELADIGYDVR